MNQLLDGFSNEELKLIMKAVKSGKNGLKTRGPSMTPIEQKKLDKAILRLLLKIAQR